RITTRADLTPTGAPPGAPGTPLQPVEGAGDAEPQRCRGPDGCAGGAPWAQAARGQRASAAVRGDRPRRVPGRAPPGTLLRVPGAARRRALAVPRRRLPASRHGRLRGAELRAPLHPGGRG